MNKIDILAKEQIDFLRNLVDEYYDHLNSISDNLKQELGPSISVPLQLQDAMLCLEGLINIFGRNERHVILKDEYAVQMKSIVMWKISRLDAEIEDRRKKIVSEELLKPLFDEKNTIVRLLSMRAYEEIEDREFLTLDMFLKPVLESDQKLFYRNPVKGNCFIVIASDRDPNLQVHDARFKNSIKPAVVDAGYKPIRNVDGSGPNWFSEMIHNLRTCELAVVDLTDLRSNCIWELGVLNAWDVPVVLIQPSSSDLPSDIFVQRVSVFYGESDNKSLDELRRSLKDKIMKVMSNQDRGKFLPRSK